MKYCIDYSKQTKILNKVDEVTIRYNPNDITLLEFLLNNKSKRVNIYIENTNIEDEELEKILALFNVEELSLYLKISEYNSVLISKLQERKIPFFLEQVVNNWDLFWGFLSVGVSDIYIAEDLCFELEEVSQIAHKIGVQIRTFPNVAQSQWKDTDALKKFFIRPEDVDIYEPYIDVLEFYGTPDKIDTLYKIYAIDKKWFGKLNEIIIGFNSELDNRFLAPKFATYRLNCRKRCNKGKNCHICYNLAHLSETFKKNGLLVAREKEDTTFRTEAEFNQDIVDLLQK